MVRPRFLGHFAHEKPLMISTLPNTADSTTEEASALRLHPFLHVDGDKIHHPLTDTTIGLDDARFAPLAAIARDASALADLDPEHARRFLDEGWLSRIDDDPSRRFRLKVVSLEAHTICNQACYFCPVSIAPREDYFMPTALYERIVSELSAFRSTIDAVFMINYNEPTVDKRFLDQVKTIKAAGLPPAVLTNGSGLTPERIDALVEMGGLRYLSINLSTLDRERYTKERGGDHLVRVLSNVEYAKDRAVAERMDIVVLGTGDENHQRDFAEITERFRGSRFNVKSYEVMDRAGYLQIGLKVSSEPRTLRGCDNVGSRPLEHLHITPRAHVVLCCEDYDEYHKIGDLTEQSVLEVLEGDEIAKLRRWTYGLEEAPANYICRKCTFARFAPRP